MNRTYATLMVAPMIMAAALVPRTAIAQSSCGTYVTPYTTGDDCFLAYTRNATGFYGYDEGDGYGVNGASYSGYGVYGSSTDSDAIHGTVANAYSGVAGFNTSTGNGVYGSTATGYGVQGYATGNGYAVGGACGGASCYAGYFTGNVLISGCAKIDGTTYGTCSSDRRLKKNIQPLVGALDDIVRLRPVTYEWIDSKMGDGTQMGFIAQDVEQVRPDWVTVDDQGFKKINMGRLPTMLVDSVRALKTENDDLRVRVKSLEDGRRPLMSGFGEGWIGVGLLAVAGAMVMTRRKRPGVSASLR